MDSVLLLLKIYYLGFWIRFRVGYYKFLRFILGPSKLNITKVNSEWMFEDSGIEEIGAIRYRQVEGWVGRKRLKWFYSNPEIIKGVQLTDEEAYPVLGTINDVKNTYRVLKSCGVKFKQKEC